MRKKWKLAAGAVLVAAVVAVLTAALGGTAKQHVGARPAAHEISALADSDEAARHFDRTVVTAASFGPNVREGTFEGVSPAVSDLPGTTITSSGRRAALTLSLPRRGIRSLEGERFPAYGGITAQ